LKAYCFNAIILILPAFRKRRIKTFMSIATVLLDCEGTVIPGAYIKHTLRLFAYQRLARFVRENHAQEEVRYALTLLSEEQGSVERNRESRPESLDRIIESCLEMMRKDGAKSGALRRIEELIWKNGFLSGELCSEIFADVPLAFRNWRMLDRRIAAYSSSHAEVQELFFRYSEWGDLAPLIDSFFDHRMGDKNAAQSYRRILAELKCRPEEVLFASDAAEQVDAAQETGMVTALVARSGTPLACSTHQLVPDLSVLVFD
jgi:enolase-phosphatase E1